MIPSLLSNGLLDSMDSFNFKQGYYRIQDIFLVISFMILARIKTINKLSSISPGEWGCILGLDRIPEMKKLREKTDELSHGENEKILDQWVSDHSSKWMDTSDGTVGHFYLDGHVRTYFGNTTKLPYRYVPRQKLCLRGMTDYWVNEESGKPLFSVTTPFSKGLISMLKEEIIPKLLAQMPNQPSEIDFENDKQLYRFVMIFDREGYSMKLFKELWEDHRIACQTYNKYPKENWEENNFSDIKIDQTFKGENNIKIAEKDVSFSKDFKYREIRVLTDSGHQVSVCTTDFKGNMTEIFLHMNGRTTQENFFKYARQEYNIDTLASYEKDAVDDTVKVVNPEYRRLEKALNSDRSKLSRRVLKRDELSLKDDPTDKQVKDYEEKMADLIEEITDLTDIIIKNKGKRKNTNKHITVKELPEEFKFVKFQGGRKKFLDIIKMIVYRAEASMANIILPYLTTHDKDTARTLIKTISQTSANIIPDYENKKLKIELHFLNKHKDDKIINHLMEFLNKTDYCFPGTDLKLFYSFRNI